MERSGVLVSVGFDPLFHELCAAALSIHGWRVVSLERERRHSSETTEIVLAASLPDADAVIANVRRARNQFPGAKVVLLETGAAATDVIRCIEEGVCAFVPSSIGITELIHTLEMVRSDRSPSSGPITQLVLRTISRLSRAQPVAADGSPLTDREKEILHLIGDGLSNKEIASRLDIAPSTVKNHVHRLLDKLKVRSRREAACVNSRRPLLEEPLTASGETGNA